MYGRLVTHERVSAGKRTNQETVGQGLGRVITLRLGLRTDATGQLYRDAADLSNFLLRLDRKQPSCIVRVF